ncbi:MAG: ATP-binding protein [Caldisericia bacterium]|nr:ATP-binding protein [Caldisericia bacterium]
MKRSNLEKRLIRQILISLLISFIFIISVSTFYIRREFIKSYELNLIMIANSISEEIKKFHKENRINEIDSFIKSIKILEGYRITIIDENGVVLGDSIFNIEFMDNHKSRPEVIEALNEKIGKSIRFSTTTNEDMLYIAVPINIDNKKVVIRTSLSLKELNRVIFTLISEITTISIISFLIGFYILYLYSKKIRESLNLINLKISKIIKGEFKDKIILKNEEFKEIDENINILGEKIENLLDQVDINKDRLNSILTSTDEVIFVVDQQGIITFANKKFEEFFNEKNFINKYYWSIIKDLDILTFIENGLKRDFFEKKEFEKLNGFYLISKSLIDKTKERIFTIFDITSIKKFEEIKRDFVKDASHELKTPITVIKGFIETIENEVKNKKYIEIIKRNIDRMINIINDLLTLSKLEEKKEIEMKEFDFKKTLQNILKIFEEKIKNKGLDLILDIKTKDTTILGDEFKIEQVLINLIDNAINYTDSGYIKISFYKDMENAYFEIEDSGIGIPKESLNRIFERFYVVDKSRSRKSGGTGLGLSIVKHIIILHKGKIEVESELGKGTKFKITLPQKLTEN